MSGTRILGINGSLNHGPSKGRALLDAVLAGAQAEDASASTDVLELRDFALEFCDGRAIDQYGPDTQRAIALVEESDAIVVATPVYRASYTGALKNFFDLMPNEAGLRDPLRGKPVGLIASGGSYHHYLVIEHQLRPLFGFFGSITAARGVYASRESFDAQRRPTGEIVDELHALGRELILLARHVSGAAAPTPLGIRRD